MANIPQYVEDRLRRPIPIDLCVVSGSTPVLSFGALHTAKMATLGLNPSRVEFQGSNGIELVGKERRLATSFSLGVADMHSAPVTVLQQVIYDCDNYFNRNPYKSWFGKLEPILKACGASYFDGSACHLDLVQWATNPTWRGLDKKRRDLLLEADTPFLLQQLQSENLRVLLVNGMGVLQKLEKILLCQFKEELPITDNHRCKSQLFTGEAYGRVLIIGWSINLQSSFGVTSEFRDVLAERVKYLTQTG